MANENMEELQKKAEKMLEEASKVRELSDDEVEQAVGGTGVEDSEITVVKAFACPSCGRGTASLSGEGLVEDDGRICACIYCKKIFILGLNKTGDVWTKNENAIIEGAKKGGWEIVLK